MYYGDIHLSETHDFKFCTTSAATGAPTVLAGSPVISAYVDNGTTQITAGLTLTVDFDGVVGLNNVRVVASGGNGYAAGTNVDLVITTGTVGGTSAVGYVVASFSIDFRGVNRWLGTAVATPATAGIPDVNVKNIDNDAASASGTVTFPNATLASTTNITGGVITTVTTLTNLPAITSNWLTAAGIAAAALNGKGDWMVSYTQPSGFLAATFPSGTIANTTNITAGTIATVTTVTNQLTAAAIATGVWQDATAGDFTAASSIGKSLYTSGVVPGGTNGLFIAGTNAATVVTTSFTTTFTGNLTGSAASVTARVTANTDQLAGQTVTAAAGVTFPTSVASPTNITAGTITTVTTLTNAPSDSSGVTTLLSRIGGSITISGGIVSADIKKVNAVTVNGNGAGTPWGP